MDRYEIKPWIGGKYEVTYKGKLTTLFEGSLIECESYIRLTVAGVKVTGKS